jgi:hypothetical protein
MTKQNKKFFNSWGIASVIILLAVGITYARPKQERRVTISISIEEANVILKALGKLPLEESGNLYFSVQQQVQTQLQPVPPAVKKDSTSKTQKKP